MATQKTIEGPTPHGGVRATAFFYDQNRSPVEEKDATGMEIIEYDKDGKEVFRTYMENAEKPVRDDQ